jgi:hypothetical protein
VPLAEGSNTYDLHPKSVKDVRYALFAGLAAAAPAQAALVKGCLRSIDELRDEYGIAANDPRHPDVQSGKPWPEEALPFTTIDAAVGQQTPPLKSIDLARPLTGYPHVDRKLVETRNALWTSANMVQKELIDAFELAIPLANLAGQAISDNMFDAVISEGEFQKRVRSFLRSHPNIGSALEEHPRAAGGITDLSLHGIRLELKSEKEKHLAFADCEQFVEQTASYAVGSGKKLAVLCVLDCSAKTKTAFPIEDGIGFFVHRRTETLIHVLTILIQGNLAKPSEFSRKRR